MSTNNLSVRIFNSPSEAPNHNDDLTKRAASLDEALIVRNGTVGGRATVDLIFHDKEGNEFVAMVTGGIIKNLAAAIEGAERRR